MDDDADLVVVFGGTNDYGHGDAPIGAFEDRDPSTFYGGCHFLMKGLIEKYPEATIVIMTPLHRAVEERVRNGETLYLKKYVEIIKEVAEYYSLPVIDLWAISGIQPKVDVIKAKYCPDGLHPNDAGHVLVAERIGNFLERL
jgi:lysophospholipase L1-like esterase